MIKRSYLKVEEEYREWIEQCSAEKSAMVEQYENKLKEAQYAASKLHIGALSQEKAEADLEKREEEIARLVTINVKQTNELKNLRLDNDRLEKTKL